MAHSDRHSQVDEAGGGARHPDRVAELEKQLEASRRAESELRGLLENSSVGVYRTTLDGRILFVNPPMRRIIDAPDDVPVGSISARTAYKDPADRDRLIALLKASGRVEGYEAELVSQKGRPVTVLIYARLIGDEMVGTMVDVSARREAERARQASETAYRDLVEHINDVLFTLDEKGLVTYVTPVVERVLGFTPRELAGAFYRDLIHPEDAARVLKAFRDVLDGKLYPSDFRMKTRSGEYRWVRTSSQPIVQDGTVRGLRGLLTDISEWKKAEQLLQASEERYRTLVENAPESIARLDSSNRFILVNKTFCRMSGLTPEQVIGHGPEVIRSFYFEEDDRHMAAAVERAITTRVRVELDAWATDCQGRRVCLHHLIYPWFDANGVPQGLEIVAHDVTEHRRAEEAMRQSEGLYRTLVDNIRMGITLIDRDHRVVMTNAAQEVNFRRVEPNPFAGKLCYKEFEGRDAICPHCPGVLAMADGKVHAAEAMGVRPDGSQFPVLIHAFPVPGPGGSPSGFIEVVECLEDRRAAEAAVKESEDRLRLLSDLSFEGVALLGDGRVLDANGTFAAMFGYEAKDLEGMAFSELVEPEYRNSVEEKIAFRDEKTFEVMGRRKDGSDFAVELSLKTTNYKGRRCRYVSVRDVSARKKLERHLVMVASRERMRMRMQLHDGVCQQLSGIGMVAKALSGDLGTKSRAEAATAESIVKMLSVVIDQARSLAKDLQPIAQDSSALSIGLDELVRRTGKIVKARCRFSANMKIEVQDHEAASQFYLIGQEALSNAVRHSGAKNIEVSLIRTGDILTLRVADDGKGLSIGRGGGKDGAKADDLSARMGLDIMRYRAGLIGAALRIEPARGGGTVVECEWRGR